MSKKDKARLADYLKHIVEAISLIETYVEDVEEQQFLNDKKTQDAVIRNLEINGVLRTKCEMFWHTDTSALI